MPKRLIGKLGKGIGSTFTSNGSSNSGFTMVEVLIVATIVALTFSFMAISFSRNRVDLDQTINVFISDVKNAQVEAAASTKYEGRIRCGYGVRFITADSYAIYVGPDAEAPNDCSTYNRNFGSGDTDIKIVTFSNPKVEFKNNFSNIFFEPPQPYTYINNVFSYGQASQPIIFGEKGGSCPAQCKTIYVHPSGKIE